MTEAEWLTCEDPREMVSFLKAQGRARKLRLGYCASARLIWQQFTDIRCRQAVEASERFADGGCKLKELHRARMNAEAVLDEVRRTFAYLSPQYNGAYAAQSTARKDEDLARRFGFDYVSESVPDGEQRAAIVRSQHALLRDIFGNPFRPVTLDPSWLTSNVLLLAGGIYEERAFDRMPILADALQDAGCANDDVLAHCRGAGPHVRGCWVVDLLLGKW